MRSRLIATLVLLLPMFAANAQSAQTDSAAVMAVVNRLFEGMRTADSAKVRSALAPGARFVDADTMGGLQFTQVDRWVAAIARSAGRWEERIYDVQVRVDENLAQVWAPYTFYLAGKISHCGTDAAELTRTSKGEWKITQLADTHREQACPDPRAQDSLYFFDAARVSVRDLSAMPWTELRAGLRGKTVVGSVGSVTFFEIDPGVSTNPHHHTREQVNVGLVGTPHLIVDGRSHPLPRLTTVITPSEVAHSATNISRTTATALEFHTARRLDFVPPMPRVTFPAAPEPRHLAPSERILTAFDTLQAAPGTARGSTSALSLHRLRGDGAMAIANDGDEHILFVVDGEGTIGSTRLAAGYVAAVPPSSRSIEIRTGAGLTVLEFRVTAR